MLDYKLPPKVGVVCERLHKKYKFHNDNYTPGQTMKLKLTTGSYFIDMSNSWMSFDVNVTTSTGGTPNANPITFGSGSVLNIFRNSLVLAKSGKELSRHDMMNVANRLRVIWENDRNYGHGIGRVMGCMNSQLTSSSAGNVTTNSVFGRPFAFNGTWTYGFGVPMKYISRLFDTNKLLPPVLADCMRLELQLESFATAFARVTASDGASYSVKNVFVHLACVKLADAVEKAVLSKPISMSHVEVHHNSGGR